jgi:hypothetical protein
VSRAVLQRLGCTGRKLDQPAAAPPPTAPQLEAGGCGWWQRSLGGELVPSSYVCATQCVGGTCRPVNICELLTRSFS